MQESEFPKATPRRIRPRPPEVPPKPPARRISLNRSKFPTELEIELQLKKFVVEIVGIGIQSQLNGDGVGGFFSKANLTSDFLAKFIGKLQGPPWHLTLHQENLLGCSNMQVFVEFIKTKLEKNQRDGLLLPKNPRPRPGDILPLSFPQEQIWLQMQEARAPTLYNYSGNYYFPGNVNPDAMKKTLDFLIQRHETLRCTFLEIDGKPCQRLVNFPCKLQVLEFSKSNLQAVNLERILTKNLYKPFEFDSRPFLRVYLFIVKDSFFFLQFVGHHLISDGTGYYIFEHDLRKTYAAFVNGSEPILPPVKISYSDYVLWQRETCKFDESPSAVFWRNYLEGITALEIPRDKPKTSSIGLNSARVKFKFSVDLSNSVRVFSQSSNVTPFVTLLGGLNALFYRYIPQTSISLLTAKHGRTNSKLKDILGHFINTLVIRTAMSGNLTFNQLVRNINSCLTKIYEHEEFPFQYVLRDLIANSSEIEIDKVALFPVFVVLMPKVLGQSSGVGNNYTDIDNNLLTNELTIIFDAGSVSDSISGYIKYNPVIHSRGRILRMISHLKTLLDNSTKVSELPVNNLTLNELSILPVYEQGLLNTFGIGKNVYFNCAQTLIETFEHVARSRPDNLAVLDGKEEISYKLLNQKATALAIHLQGICTASDQIVAIFLPQSLQFLTCALSILKITKTVVPISVHASVKQVETMLQELANPVLISTTGLLKNLGLIYAPVLLLDEFPWEIQQNKSKIRRNGAPTSAYCMFTSGSTGKPKAVMVDNSSIVNLVNWMQSEFEIMSSDRSLFFSNSAYDASLLEYWPYFLTGAAVLIPPYNFRYQLKELMQWVSENRLTVLNLPTAMASCLISRDFPPVDKLDLKSLRLLTCGGEKLHACRTSHLSFKVVNSYGLTESCVLTTSGSVDEEILPSIGKPIWNTQVYVLDANLKFLPIGVTGEICIGGAGVSRGYLNNPELTSQKFVENLYGSGTLCRTGDLGYWLPDGNLCIVGRCDYQVKIRGHRVELGEIEEVLSAHSSVQQAIILIENVQKDNSKMVIAYCETKFKTNVPPFEEMKIFLQDRLPYYAIPTSIYFLDHFPYNANGKVDRIELRLQMPTEDGAILLSPKFEPLLSPEEEIVASIWADVLGIPVSKIGRHSNFFALGGQSLLIADVVNRIAKSPLLVNVKVADLFRDPSLYGFTQVIKSKLDKSTEREESKVIDLNNNMKQNRSTPVMLSLPQEQIWMHMQESQDPTIYNEACGLIFEAELNIPAMKQSIHLIFERHQILKSYILEIHGKPYQMIQKFHPNLIELPVVDLSKVTLASELEEICRIKMSESRQKPFDFTNAPLIRFSLLKCPNKVTHMQIVFHHLIMDAIGMNIFETELRYFYKILMEGQNCHLLPELEYQYADFAIWQRDSLTRNNNSVNSAKEFWKTYLKGATPLELQTDRPRGSTSASGTVNLRSGSTGIQLSAELSRAIKKFSQRENTTVFITLVAALKALIYQYTKQNDILIVCATSGRNEAKFENLIGYFVNMTILRIRNFPGKSNFPEFVKQVHESAASVYEYQDYPFQSAIKLSDDDQNNLSTSKFFRLGVTMEPRICKSFVPGSSDSQSTFFFEKIDYGSKFELLICFDEVDEQIQVLFAFNRHLYNQSRIDLMASHFQHILQNAIGFCTKKDSISKSIEMLDFMTADEKGVILGFGLGECCQSNMARLEELFEIQAGFKAIGETAILSHTQEITYKILNQKATSLRDQLEISILTIDDEFVAILLPQSVDFIISTLAILKAGKTVAPLSVDYSMHQISFMLQHLKTPLLITITEILRHKELNYNRIFCLDLQVSNLICSQEKPEVNTRINIRNNPIAYCIFTSGSTGPPKAVLVRHDAIVNFVNWMRREYKITNGDKSFLFCSPAFDFTFAEIWPFLLSGGTLCISPDDLRHCNVDKISKWIMGKGVTLACLPTFLAEKFFNQIIKPEKNSPLKWLISAGECLRSYPPPDLPYTVSNWYGLTEATVMTTFINFDTCRMAAKPSFHDKHFIPPVGKPISNTQIYVLDSTTLEFKPVGITGEIFIGGFGISPGYFAQGSDLNDKKFIPDHLGLSGRLCRTGDLGYWLPDGNLVVVGRTDCQIKIRGFRFELGEVEGVLREIPEINQVVVVQKLTEKDTLIAYCTAIAAKLDIGFDLLQFLKKRLPQYAIPTSVFLVKEFPLNAVGKIDKKTLLANADFESHNLLRRDFTSPQTKEEKLVAELWAEILGQPLDKISRMDDFFSLGGHSMLATEVVSKLRASPYFIVTRVVDVFRQPTLFEFALLINFKNNTKNPENIISRQICRTSQNFPLSYSQEQIWLHSQKLQRPLLYNEAFSLNIIDPSNVDIEAIEMSLFKIFQRHQILRASIQEINGIPYQRICRLNSQVQKIKVLDLSRRTESMEKLESCSKQLATRRQEKKFNLYSGSLFRVYLIKFSSNYVRMQIIFHHLVMDAVSIWIFERELRKFYEIYKNNKNIEINLDNFIPPLVLQYSDYVLSQRNLNDGEISGESCKFWKEYLKNLVPLEFPAGFLRHFRKSEEVKVKGHSSLTLNLDISTKIKQFSRDTHTTPFVVFLTAIKVLLYRYTKQDDIFIVSTSSGRSQHQTEDLIGHFVNMIIIRTIGIESGQTFQQLVKRVHESATSVYEHQDVPFQSVISNAGLNVSKSGLLRVVVTMEPRIQNLDNNRPNCSAFSESLNSQPKYELTFGIDEIDGCYILGFTYDPSVLCDEPILNLPSHFGTLILDALSYPTKCIHNLNLLTTSEEKLILDTWNQTNVKFPEKGTILEQFEACARIVPKNIAIIDELQTPTSYASLNSEADFLARALFNKNLPNELICIFLPQSKKFLISTIAIMKISKICVPISVHVPVQQVESMLDQLENPILITTKMLTTNNGLRNYARIFFVDDINASISTLDKIKITEDLEFKNASNPTAYCVFTSGSTGVPKAVMVEHGALANLVNWMHQEFQITSTDKSLLFCSPAFDMSFSEIWPFLTLGASLCISPESTRYSCSELRKFVQESTVTFVNLPTSAVEQFFTSWEFETTAMRQLIFGGEKLNSIPAAKLPFRVTHCYGLTETTVISTFANVNCENDYPASTVGKPIPNVQVYVLDNTDSPSLLPIGVSGDIYIGGVGVSPGYFKNPSQTTDKFVRNHFSRSTSDLNLNDKLCKTGDLGYWLPDGNLCIIGRSDSQVKFRGYRIELGEIESAFSKFPAIQQVVVQIDSENVLTAYCVLKINQAQNDFDGLGAFLQQRLPYYAIPTGIYVIPSFPLNPVGKIDKKALKTMRDSESVKCIDISKCGPVSKPQTNEERMVSEIWAKVLQRPIDSFNRKDNFFLIGGNSMLIMQVIPELRILTGRTDVTTSTIFSNPVLEDLAKMIKRPVRKIPNKPAKINYFKEKVALNIPKSKLGVRVGQTAIKHENIFLTGATGYLGSGLLAELLVKSTATIYCLVRASGAKEASERVRSCISPFQLAHADSLFSRVICLAGDLTFHNFGLGEAEYTKITAKIDTVFHCAAEVHFLKTYEELRKSNVESTKNVLRFVARDKLKILHYISTLGVLGYKGLGYQGSGRKSVKETRLNQFIFGPNDLTDGYNQTKWVAEKLVWEAFEDGVPGIVYRPGEIGCHSKKNIINGSDMFATVVKSCVELKHYPKYEPKLPYGSLDFICESIINISLKSDAPLHYNKVFHVFEHLVGIQEIFETRKPKISPKSRPTAIPLGLKEWRDTLLRNGEYKENAKSPINLLSLYLSQKADFDEVKMLALLEKQNLDNIIFSNANLISVLGANGSEVKKVKDLFRYTELLLC